MSSQLRDLSTNGTEGEQRSLGRHEDVGTDHPRGMGFSVLSRIARSRSDESDYAPRHRLDAPVDSGAGPAAI